MVQSEISFGAAQSYLETYYLQLKATQVSFIPSLTNLQPRQASTQDLTGPIRPSWLTVPYMWTVNRANKRKVEPGKLRGQDEESNVLLQNEERGSVFIQRKEGKAIFKHLRRLICRPAKPLYSVANVKCVPDTSRSP